VHCGLAVNWASMSATTLSMVGSKIDFSSSMLMISLSLRIRVISVISYLLNLDVIKSFFLRRDHVERLLRAKMDDAFRSIWLARVNIIHCGGV
jgi:hypothetical protein